TNATRSVPGQDATNNWTERGPDNIPGRTRAMLYDPNDPTHKRVFAGGVTGGLWVINDIEDANSVWQRVNIPKNLAVSAITVDVNNSNTFYLGSGEPYVGGEGTGNGVWKSTDGGVTWNRIFGGSSGATTLIYNADLVVNSPSGIAGNYVAVQAGFGPALTNTGITGDLILANDNGSTLACTAFGPDATGKIAVIDRGNCNFTVKVKNAQDNGAVGVIMIQSLPDFPFTMGGTDATITIPSVMISKADGELLKNAIANGTVNASLSNRDTGGLPSGIRLVPGKFIVNDIVTRNNNNTTEIYAAITETYHTSINYVLGGEIGVYKSTDGGQTWALLNFPLTADGNPHPINDLYIAPDNTMYAGSINSYSYKKADGSFDGGGKVFKSTDGTTFEEKFSIPNGNRVELAGSATNANKIYELCYTTDSQVKIYKSTFAFNFPPSSVTLPNDPSTSPPNDFTNSQGWYDLGIAVDPTNDNIVYAAGISVFKSINSGASWSKISEAYGFSNASPIHPDAHNIVMHPTDSNKGLIATDGGVYYVNDFSNAENNSNAIKSRGNGYNTTQFYKGAIGQDVNNDKLLGGAQDNGSNFINNATAGINSSMEVGGGDGMYCFIDKDGAYMITSVYQNAYYRYDINGNFQTTIVNNQNEGSFVNIAELDDNRDVLFSNASNFDSATSAWNINISRFNDVSASATRADFTDAMITRPPTAMKVSPYTTTSSTLFIGTDSGDLYKVTNADSNPVWTDLTPPAYETSFLGSISAINFGANENEIIVTFHNYGVVNVYYSEDGGQTWQNKEGDLPDLPVKDVLMNPLNNDQVILATDLGVWQTGNFKDANPNWSRSHNGMQNVKVTSFDLRTSDNTVLASTYGRGFFTGQFTATANVNENLVNKNSITIYPTVSDGNFKIKTNTNLDSNDLQIFDVTGKLATQRKVSLRSGDESNISVSLQPGIYFVKIKNTKLTSKIIIK
ncbi:MAG TPA: T9SS type A sorting domain-containing protein, partial [Flavobacteriia bacterium]|nr:T9SS type A sorting domain-containing protein [Flavobacteriia bacterium]